MTTVLVTGGAGFIGSHLCDRLLAEGKRVVAVDDLSKGRIANLAEARAYGQQFGFYNMDIRAGGLAKVFERLRPDIVMHLAAQASVSASVEDPSRDASVNILGLLNILQASAATGVHKVVFAASGGTLYGEPRKLPVAETARRGARPNSPYGISKKIAEDYLAFYRRTYDVDFTALALANVYGPRQDPSGEAGVVAIFAQAMLEGRTPVVFGDGRQTRDYVYVDDVVHAFALAAELGAGGLFNVGTGKETSVLKIFRELAKITEFSGKPDFRDAREGEVMRSALDVTAAREQLGWKPWTKLADGLRATVDSLRVEG